MKQIELIWRELLYQTIEQKHVEFSQTDLAKRLHCSLSTVSLALSPLKSLGIVNVGKRYSSVVDWERMLFYWATRRSLYKDVVYKTYSPLSVFEREGLMPSDVIATAYSASRLYYKIVPSDYDSVYFYSADISSIENRFPLNTKEPPNIFILKSDAYLVNYKTIPLSQVFVDLWSLPEWYAKEYYDNFLICMRKKTTT